MAIRLEADILADKEVQLRPERFENEASIVSRIRLYSPVRSSRGGVVNPTSLLELRGKSNPVRPDTASGQLLKQYLAYVVLRARSLQVNEFKCDCASMR
jgi:hypothetical protein